MPRVRYEITAKLELLSPLHIGTGDRRTIASVRGDDGSNRAPDVAAIARDVAGDPYIPATTLKGCLRRLGEEALDPQDQRLKLLFGDLASRRAGMVQVRGASLDKTGDASQMPFVDGTSYADGGLGPGVFVAARTSVNPAKGIAEDHKLHHAEMVAPGAQFAWRLIVEARGVEAGVEAEAATRHLLAMLGLLAERDGAAIGRGAADGNGRVRLVEGSIIAFRRELTASGDLDSRNAGDLWRSREALVARPTVATSSLTLVADGPYLVADASRKPRGRQPADRRRPQLAAQRTSDGKPLVFGSGVSGALRARARWLSALAKMPASENETDLDCLSSEQRLFGTAGFKGLLSIEVECIGKPQLWTAASVKIDRFTGGPIQNALFHTEAFVGTKLRLALRLAKRPGRLGAPSAADVALFNDLVADVRDNGLMLGHGVNRGYGWFRAEAARWR